MSTFPAAFDGPARAIRCAQAALAAVRPLGLEIRGIAVHTGARVSSLASPGEVLVSQTVKDLIAGSDIELDDRGAHELKGVPGEWRLYAVR